MNNHGIICKNNNMIIFFIVLVIFILILINKKVKFDIDFSVIGFEYNFCVNINYFFDIITLYKEDILKYRRKFNKKIQKISNINKYFDNENSNFSDIENQSKKQKQLSKKTKNYKWIVKYINVDRINIESQIGVDDVFVTSMIIPTLSSILAIVFQKYFPQATKRFLINPVYNKFYFGTKGAIYITIKLKDVIYIVFRSLKERKNVKST